MGEVYDATDLRSGARVAIKVLTVDDAGASQRLKREAAHASALDHPNICKVLEVAEDESGAFIAMEFLEGTCCWKPCPQADSTRLRLFGWPCNWPARLNTHMLTRSFIAT